MTQAAEIAHLPASQMLNGVLIGSPVQDGNLHPLLNIQMLADPRTLLNAMQNVDEPMTTGQMTHGSFDTTPVEEWQ